MTHARTASLCELFPNSVSKNVFCMSQDPGSYIAGLAESGPAHMAIMTHGCNVLAKCLRILDIHVPFAHNVPS